MTYVRTITLVIFAYALHLGCTASVHIGWSPQPLVLLAILGVWLDRVPSAGRVLLPAAFLVDLIQPTRIPLTTLAVATAWFIAMLVQRQWLTNHSLASLFGLSVLGIFTAAGVSAAAIWLLSSLGASASTFRDAWTARGMLQTVGVEVIVLVLLGVLIRILSRFVRSRFFYAAR